MTKTKLLFTTFVIFMSLVFIYHLLEEKEIDKKSNDPPRHLDARDNSGLHQQSEEFGSNQTKDQPEPPFHKDKTSPSSPEELVYQETTLVKNQNNPHVNGGETERIVEKNTSDKTQLHAQGDSQGGIILC